MTMKYAIYGRGDGASSIVSRSNHTGTSLDVPLNKTDLIAMIHAAFQAPDSSPRVEMNGVTADKMANGVRVRNTVSDSWFDVPWSVIAQGTFEES